MSGRWPMSLSGRAAMRVLRLAAKPMADEELASSAIIFAPHFDDEVLGCGGTIILKRQAGARIKLVFMTDGSASHKLIPADQLAQMRQAEALEVAKALGLETSDVVMLNFPDGKLAQHRADAAIQVARLLGEGRYEQVFLPHHGEAPVDHWMTHEIVLDAVCRVELSAMMFSYPVWLWSHWPWSGRLWRPRARASIRQAACAGVHLLKDFRCVVGTGSVVDQKAAALELYRSQMSRLGDRTGWATLGDVNRGQFLGLFLGGFELFARWAIGRADGVARGAIASSTG